MFTNVRTLRVVCSVWACLLRVPVEGFRNQQFGIAVAVASLLAVIIAGLEKVGFRKYDIRKSWEKSLSGSEVC